MSSRLTIGGATFGLVVVGAMLPAQTLERAACLPAAAHALSTEVGGFLLSIPGVANDFVLFADGQWLVRADGTARLTALAQRAGAVDRQLFLELTFDGLVRPGQAGYPPAGSPVATMQPQAYVPIGTVNTQSFTYFTQVSGTVTGLRAYSGLRISISNAGNAQVGDGATNKNLASGLAIDLQLTVLQPSTSDAFNATGPAQLRANFETTASRCATHSEPDAQFSAAQNRLALNLPGLFDDYLFVPRGNFQESNGTATISGIMRRQQDYDDVWLLDLSFAQRLDPGDANYPPGPPAQGLLPNAYVANGGPIDPAAWRYYLEVSGYLIGSGRNDGATIEVTAARPVQIGLGAGQGNAFFGLTAVLAPNVLAQPFSHTLALTDDISLHANLATSCILPPPIITSAATQSIETVTSNVLTFTGTDLGFVEQGAIGPTIVGDDERRWLEGHVRVVDHETIELAIPQGLAADTYPLRFLSATRASNQLFLQLVEPLSPTVATESDRLAGEAQHWVTHQGDIVGFAFCFVVVSLSEQPSSAPGLVELSIGNQFSDYVLVDVAVQDSVTRTSVVTMAQVPISLTGMRLHAQCALMDQAFFPLHASNATFTDY